MLNVRLQSDITHPIPVGRFISRVGNLQNLPLLKFNVCHSGQHFKIEFCHNI